MQHEQARMADTATLGAATAAHESVKWHAHWFIHQFDDPTGEIAEALQAGAPLAMFPSSHIIEREGNLLLNGGASILWQTLIGNGTTTAGQALTYFNNANAAIGVGDSTTAAAATQTDVQAATNKLRKAMDATYPQHTDGTAAGNATITFRSTFASADANFAWNEWGIHNSATLGAGRMLNRKVETLGTKASGSTWTFTCTLTLG